MILIPLILCILIYIYCTNSTLTVKKVLKIIYDFIILLCPSIVMGHADHYSYTIKIVALGLDFCQVGSPACGRVHAAGGSMRGRRRPGRVRVGSVGATSPRWP